MLPAEHENVERVILTLVTMVDNEALTRTPSYDEIRSTVFYMDPKTEGIGVKDLSILKCAMLGEMAW